MKISTFARLSGMVKNVKRAGWLRYLPAQNVQSVADHSCRIAMLTMALRNVSEKIDQTKCMEMALIHDIGEGLVGDYTPYCDITKQQKFEKEFAAVKQILEPLGKQNYEHYIKLWLEYENADTYEALIVKDLDKYEMIRQAFQYEQKYGVDLTEFYNCISKMNTKEIKEWAQELVEERNQFLAQKNKK